MMHHRFNKGWQNFVGFAHPVPHYAGVGRLLLLLASIVLIAIPYTQHAWTWDRFLHGGHDFETNVLLILTTLCLVLVLVHSYKQAIHLLITTLTRFLLRLPELAIARFAWISFSCSDRILGTPISGHTTPLLI
jgi:hypothetical protein